MFRELILIMIDFQEITGDLYVKETENPNDKEYFYDYVVFKSDNISIVLSGMRFFPVKESNFQDKSDDTFYYPCFNESSARVYLSELDEDLKLYKENIKIEYTIVNNNIYIKSESEITAYGGINLYIEKGIYKIHTPPLILSGEDFEKDNFLGIEEINEAVLVENIKTGIKYPVKEDKVTDLLENNEKNGLLRLEEPKTDYLPQIIKRLRN